MPAQSYRDLHVWQRAMDLAVEIYRITDAFPRHQLYGLAAQLRRAAVSVVANIAEGNRRIHRADYLRFLSVARGSLAEIETQLELATRLEYVDARVSSGALERADHVGRMLTKLCGALRTRASTTPDSRLPTP